MGRDGHARSTGDDLATVEGENGRGEDTVQQEGWAGRAFRGSELILEVEDIPDHPPRGTHMHPYLYTHELAPSYSDLSCVERKAQDPARLYKNHMPVTAHMDKCAHSHVHVNTCTGMYIEHSLTSHTWSLQYESVSVYVYTHISTCV